MKGLFIPGITAEMFRNGCLESIEALMAEGEIYDIEYPMEQPEPCEDCVSRQAVINAIDKEIRYGAVVNMSGLETAVDIINNVPSATLEPQVDELPSVTPKRRKGTWIEDCSQELGLRCSECGKTLDDYAHAGTEYIFLGEVPNFCPNCGADMREDGEKE